MAAYYNEIDPHVAQWLRNLIAAGHIAPGDVDERSIEDVLPEELYGYTQCHFFAGIGVWSLALRRAGWPDDRPVWTGSCPCQPFSAAGKSGGFADERHLWPAWHHLIRVCRPGVVFGEQVASKDGLGWLDLVQADLEGAGYACGAVDLCSASVGAPHIRQRLWFVAERLADMHGERRDGVHAPIRGQQVGGVEAAGSGQTDDGSVKRFGGICGTPKEDARVETGPTNGFWRAADWLFCRDGKWRPVEPGTFPLAHGATSRVVRLRAYGNAINVEAAKVVIESYLDTERV